MDDLFLRDFERKHGDTGYAFWFKTLELIGSQGEAGKLTISWANYQEKLHKRRTVVEQLLDFCSTAGKLRYREVGENLIIECDKFAEISDNYTKYDGVSTKRLQRQKEVSTKQEEKKNEEGEEKRTFLEESPEFQLSLHLFNGIRTNDAKAKEPDLQKWAAEIDKLIRIDKRTPDEIARVIEFSQSDSFWKSNILSTATLRKQFPKLFLKANNGSSSNRSGYKYDPEKYRRLAAEFAKDK